MRRAVWSFWSKPFTAEGRLHWPSESHHALCWALSVEAARKHFDELALVTDDAGAELLVERLSLPFTEVSLLLNTLEHHDPDWWMLGKLYAYRAQAAPFVHIDHDVFLWQPLPVRLLTAPVLAQNPEDARRDSPWYDVATCRRMLESAAGSWIPPAWRWYDSLNGQTAACCGIFGGQRVSFLQDYADTVIQLLEYPGNRVQLEALPYKRVFNPLFEQYLLSACAAFQDVPIEYLFRSFEDALAPGAAARAGFTHLQADAKFNLGIVRRLERRMLREYPQVYERCVLEGGVPA